MNSLLSRTKRVLPLLGLALLTTTSWTLLPAATAAPIQLHGLNYNTRKGPDWDWNKCKSDTEVLIELTMMSRVTNRIRLLSMTDCGQTAQVLQLAKEFGMRFWVGLWVGPDAQVFENEKAELQRLIDIGLIEESTILGISVGSEAIYREDATVDEMIANMNDVRTILQAAGLNIPLTICDIAPEYAANPELRSAVDVTMTNTFPFWEAIPIENAVADLQEDLGWLIMQEESQGKLFVLGETGWPSEGAIDGVGIASPDNQARYFAEAFCRIDVENNWEYYWFTGMDNEWRLLQDPDNTVEGSWGFLHANLTLKSNFENFSFQCSNGVTYSFAEVDWSIPQLTAPPVALNPASCAAHSECSGLAGNCCPGDDGVSLLCCDSNASPSTTAPAASPVLLTSSPVSIPTSTPTRLPTLPPTTPPTTPPTPRPTTAMPTSTAPIESPGPSALSEARSDPTTLPTATPTTTPALVEDLSLEPSVILAANSSFEPTSNSTWDPTSNYTFEPSASPSTPKPTVAVVFRPTASGINDPSSLNGSAALARLPRRVLVISVIVPTMTQAMNMMW